MPPSSAARGSRRDRDVDLPLPQGFKSIRDITEEEGVRPGTLINVCGMVKDFRPAIPTRNTDWKATMTLYDISTEHDEGIEFSIFRPKDNIPTVKGADVILLFRVKVQRWNGNPISLITNHQTIILVYSAAKIPKYPSKADLALQPKAGKDNVRVPTDAESTYVSYFYHKIDKGSVPEPEEFEVMTIKATNVEEKFSLLQDIQESRFCDLIVQVCRAPFDFGDRLALYVTDYTENDAFFNYTQDNIQDLDSGDADVWGYTSRNSSSANTSTKWVGPYGKKSMQVTCWEPHADIIRGEVVGGDWVTLRNVQIKTGRDGNYLEGAMREERGQPLKGKVNVVLHDLRDKDTIEPRLKDALRRFRDYMQKNKQLKAPKKPEAKREGKRKRTEYDTDEAGQQDAEVQRQRQRTDDTDENETRKMNSKGRRQRKREEQQKKVKEQEAKLRQEILGLNPLIVCESPPDRPFVSVASIQEQMVMPIESDKQKMRLPLPFVNAKYCANVRVVDFHPARLEDFARPRQVNAFDVLSDDGGSEAISSDEDDDDSIHGGEKKWEWRFSLKLEDVTPKAEEPKTIWVVVPNMEAQYLTNLDATDLRQDETTLTALREKMFKLWGELEEQKHWVLNREAEARKRKPGAAPPPSMSDDEDGSHRRQALMKNAPAVTANKPFTCCIRQYGVRMSESDPAKADAGEGYRWQRTFGLFGTKITGGV
ncbi:hypothetical protein GE09DRAFT_1175173 [Coniochaeta sp. 2T2.1]|nr:hypothetical protein GE09DRAFT_1175173 [Coniochaeta sp. 2T2.1]